MCEKKLMKRKEFRLDVKICFDRKYKKKNKKY